MITEDQIKECEKLALKYPAVKELLSCFKKYDKSPYSEVYLAAFDMIDSWRDEIAKNAMSIKIMSTDDKKFERAFSIIKSLGSIIESLDDIRSKMTPTQKEDADISRKHKKSEGKVHV